MDIVAFSAKGQDGSTFGGALYRDESVSFREQFPREEWPLPNVLRFVAVGSLHKPPRGEMAISNSSGKRIRYMRIAARDLFLVFDVQHDARVTLNPINSTFVSIDGAFADGTALPPVARNFTFLEDVRYSVHVEEGTTRLERTTLLPPASSK